ncbi:hypothetical protein SERLADRAFT_440124 [Serpula lacrymans var. lacrymans S7.9]|uniref:Uncharacterized protein n=1 Tax=Serpula lacrymans var. lacrymans (strain S7.9) TaxID=578457 RepID=F8P3K0_SERL9|nr:uncharacterized protein SERLADRAFT_440124 [Serpula lacrymans var. lacrymans S7.9]EGO22099.1 hypothetical protein SERLADRAFT_440124 [Serpula lacrymans var. lacrymans S7.9]
MTLIIFASRPLFFTELQEALAFSTGLRKISTDDLVDKETIMEACAGILVASICYHSDYSAQEYLVKCGDWAFPDPEVQITNICLDSLSMLPPKDTNPVDVHRSQGFIVYARQNWGHHARSVEKTIPMAIHDFLRDDANVENALQPMYGFDSRYFNGGSALHLCAYFVLIIDTVKLLLERDGVDVNPKDNNGRTPFWQAARKGRVEVVRLLLATDGVDVDSQDHEGWTPLLCAAHEGKAEVVELLSARHNVGVYSHKDCDSTPYTLTANQGEAQLTLSETCIPLAFLFRPPYHKELACLLVERTSVNFKVNWKDQSGFTPLWIATWHGDEKTAELLLACGGVDMNLLPMDSSVPPLWAAAYHAFSKVDEISDTSPPTHQGVDSTDTNGRKSNDLESIKNSGFQQGNETVLKLLLKRCDVDVNWQNKNREALLFIAAKNGCISLVKQLLSRDDIDTNLQDDNGDSPLHRAVHSGHKEVAALLVACDDIALNLKNALGQNPLHCTIISQNSKEQELWDACTQEKTVELLLAHSNICINLEDNSGLTPLMLACSVGRLGIVKLIEKYLFDTSLEDEVTAQFEGVKRNCVNMQDGFSFQDDTSETYYTTLDEMSETYYTTLDEVLEITEQ